MGNRLSALERRERDVAEMEAAEERYQRACNAERALFGLPLRQKPTREQVEEFVKKAVAKQLNKK